MAGKQVAKRTPAKKVPAKKAAPAAAATRSRGAARTAVQPQEVEEAAVQAAAPARQRRPPADRPAARAAAAMRGEATEPEPTPEPAAPAADAPRTTDDLATAEVPFAGRNLKVRMPTEEQLVMYRRVSREFAMLARDGRDKNMAMDEALKYLDRAVRTVQTVLIDPDDKEWLEDQLMDGKVTLEQCTDLMRSAIRMVAENNMSREERRAHANTLAALED